MKHSRKFICIILMALLLLASPLSAFAIESESTEAVETTETVETVESTETSATFSCEVIHPPSVAYVGRTISAEVCFKTENESIPGLCAYFTVNGERSIDYTFTAFEITNDKLLTFYYEPPVSLEGSTVVIGLCIERYGQKIFTTERNNT